MPSRLEHAFGRFLTPRVIEGLFVFSALAFLIGALLVPLVLSRLPADYFVRSEPSAARSGPLGMARSFARNVAGTALVVLGVALLVLPGQGILTILIGIVLLDFPGKRRFERRVIARPRVLHAVNALRARMGRPPLEIPRHE